MMLRDQCPWCRLPRLDSRRCEHCGWEPDAAPASHSPEPVAGLPPGEAEHLIRNCYRALADIYWAATNGVVRPADMADVLDRHRPLLSRLTDLVVNGYDPKEQR